jgi:hypothetical protein
MRHSPPAEREAAHAPPATNARELCSRAGCQARTPTPPIEAKRQSPPVKREAAHAPPTTNAKLEHPLCPSKQWKTPLERYVPLSRRALRAQDVNDASEDQVDGDSASES